MTAMHARRAKVRYFSERVAWSAERCCTTQPIRRWLAV